VNLFLKFKGFRSTLKLGWVFFERTRILSGIQLKTHFVGFFVVETKGFVCSIVHVILTRQICGQHSSRPAESKRRALENHFSERICYMFLISKWREDRDLGLCPSSVLVLENRSAEANFEKKNVSRRRNNRNLPLRCGSPNASTEIGHRPRSRSSLHFDIRNI